MKKSCNFFGLFFIPLLISCEQNINREKTISISDSSKYKDSLEVILKNYPISREEENFVSPSFPGGQEELKRFIKKNLWKGKDIPDNIIGKVTVSFIVLSDGSLKDFKVIENIEGCDACSIESIRLAKTMPHWIPAYEKTDNNGGRKNYDDQQAIEIEFSNVSKKHFSQ